MEIGFCKKCTLDLMKMNTELLSFQGPSKETEKKPLIERITNCTLAASTSACLLACNGPAFEYNFIFETTPQKFASVCVLSTLLPGAYACSDQCLVYAAHSANLLHVCYVSAYGLSMRLNTSSCWKQSVISNIKWSFRFLSMIQFECVSVCVFVCVGVWRGSAISLLFADAMTNNNDHV